MAEAALNQRIKSSETPATSPEEIEGADLETYRLYVECVSDLADGTVILNRSPKHAAIIISYLFKRAEKYVEILTNKLSQEVYANSDVIKAAVEFLRGDAHRRIRILHEEQLDFPTHPFVQALKNAGCSEQLLLSAIPKESQKRYKFNFALSDRKNYRFEKDRESYEAVVQFGEPRLSSQLGHVFDELALEAQK